MRELIVLDIETTGLDEKKNSIIEIAAVLLKDNKIIDKFDTLIKLPKNEIITPTIQVLTGITKEDLDNAKEFEEIKDELTAFVGDKPVIGHNISFDLDFLKAKGVNLKGNRLDTLELSQTILPKLSSYTLEYISYYFNFTNLPSHRAMNDVLATAELYDLLIYTTNSLSSGLKNKIHLLLKKSNWDWSFIFQDKILGNKSFVSREVSNNFGYIDNPRMLLGEGLSKTTGINAFELPPNLKQMEFNISLAKEMEESVLVVPNNVFNSKNWQEMGINPSYSSQYLLDNKRFEFLLNKDSLNISELKLIIKILIYGITDKGVFSPSNVFMTRDEIHLFRQKFMLLEHKATKIPHNAVMSFSGVKDYSENKDSLKNRILLIPNWLEFNDWMIESNARLITSAYFNMIISTRRDFIHDYVTNSKLSDRLFKTMNELGSHLVMTLALLGMVWQEEQRGEFSKTELDGRFLNTKSGLNLKNNILGIIDLLNNYCKDIESLEIDELILNKHLTETREIIEYLELMINPEKAHKIYLDVFNSNVFLEIVKEPIPNIWQTKFKELKTMILSNGILVDKSNTFISNILGEDINVQHISSKIEQKEIIFVHDSPDNKSVNYQKNIEKYLKNWIEKEPGKSLVVMPNNKMMEEFFDNHWSNIKLVELLSSRLVSKSNDLLKIKLEGMDKFSLLTLINQYTQTRIASSIPIVDRIALLRLNFDPPGRLPQLLVKDIFDNVFINYSLPKAIIKLKILLSTFYDKTKEFWILDNRIVSQDYGNIVRNSLKDFRLVDLDDR